MGQQQGGLVDILTSWQVDVEGGAVAFAGALNGLMLAPVGVARISVELDAVEDLVYCC